MKTTFIDFSSIKNLIAFLASKYLEGHPDLPKDVFPLDIFGFV